MKVGPAKTVLSRQTGAAIRYAVKHCPAEKYGKSGFTQEDLTTAFFFPTDIATHSALKLEKKCNFKSAKTHFFPFQKRQEIDFCTRKKFKNTKNAIFGLSSGAKIDFLPVLKM